MNDDCPFCTRKPAEIICRSQNFYVTPSVGQIVEGHLLICSNKHFLNLATLDERLFHELEQVIGKTADVVRGDYSRPFFFEHGAASQNKGGGSCIDHLHVQVVPSVIKVGEGERNIDIYERIPFPRARLRDIRDIALMCGQGYLFHEYDGTGHMSVFKPDVEVPSQYCRRLLAENVGKPDEWDWAIFPEKEKFQRVLKKLKNWKDAI